MRLTLIISLLLVFFSCKKEKPPTGLYIATLDGSFLINNTTHIDNREFDLEITESTKDSIVISILTQRNSTLLKEKKQVSGTLNTYEVNGLTTAHIIGDVTLNGEWEKINKNKYIITGEYTSYYEIVDGVTMTSDVYPIEGSIEIKPK